VLKSIESEICKISGVSGSINGENAAFIFNHAITTPSESESKDRVKSLAQPADNPIRSRLLARISNHIDRIRFCQVYCCALRIMRFF